MDRKVLGLNLVNQWILNGQARYSRLKSRVSLCQDTVKILLREYKG